MRNVVLPVLVKEVARELKNFRMLNVETERAKLFWSSDGYNNANFFIHGSLKYWGRTEADQRLWTAVGGLGL